MNELARMTWHATRPYEGRDDRLRLTRDHGLVRQTVRGYKGRVMYVDRVGRGMDERHSCDGHVHNKRSAAIACAERLARHLNTTGETPE